MLFKNDFINFLKKFLNKKKIKKIFIRDNSLIVTSIESLDTGKIILFFEKNSLKIDKKTLLNTRS